MSAPPVNLPISDSARSYISATVANLIDGERQPAASGLTMPLVHPGNAEQFGEAASSGAEDVDRAVASARRAFEDGRWRRLPPLEKEHRLHRLADLITAHGEELGELDVIDNGMPKSRGKFHMALSADLANYYAGWPTKIEGGVHSAPDGLMAYSTREPLGVCAAIIPWNGPTASAMWKLPPALATGNSIILKPAEQTPMSAVRLAELCLEAGIPEGVVNVVQGPGEVVGAALVEHPGVDKIAFTGSTDTGRTVQAAAAARLKRVSLELGGKGANVVFADADLTAAARGVVAGAWASSGQVCMAGARLIVHRSVHDEMVQRVIDLTRPMKVGSGFEPTTDLGPLASAEQFERVTGYIAVGKEQGASVAMGGEPWPGGPGYYVEPTVFTGVRNDMRIAREEIFGPVLAVIPFDTEDEAYRIANDTDYGLTAGVWTGDASRVFRAGEAIRTGTVWVNTYAELLVNLPYGGMKQSGYGRELGAAALEMYTETKSVLIRRAGA